MKNVNAMAVLNFLYMLIDVFNDYFTELCEESIRDNFVIIYELLDEMMVSISAVVSGFCKPCKKPFRRWTSTGKML